MAQAFVEPPEFHQQLSRVEQSHGFRARLLPIGFDIRLVVLERLRMLVPCFHNHSELSERVGVIRFEPNRSRYRLFRRFQLAVQVSYPAEKKPEVRIPGKY